MVDEGEGGGVVRARNIKPGFFKNEDLAEISTTARLVFIGLWCIADREGKFEWRPKRIKAEIFPYENCDIERHLMSLHDKKFIHKYSHNGSEYGFIPTFLKHQSPHPHEAKSVIPDPDNKSELIQCHDMSVTCNEMQVECNADSLNPDIRNPDIRKEKGKPSRSPKNKYLDSVFLAEAEYKKLQEAIGQKSLDVGIEKLDYSITVKGGKYRDHYKTILNWHKRGFLEEDQNGQSRGFDKRDKNWHDREIDAEAARANALLRR